MPERHEHLVSQLVLVVIEEGQVARGVEGAGLVCNLLAQRRRVALRVPAAMPMQHVQLADVGSGRQRILVHSEAVRVGEVVAQLAHELEDVCIFLVADNGDLRLDWLDGDVRDAREWSWVGLREERCVSSLGWACVRWIN